MDEDSMHCIDLPTPVLSEELSVASRAADTYRRNYFAWSHRTRVFDGILALVCMSLNEKSALDSELVAMLTAEHPWTMKWIDLHIADYTAMQYLRYVDISLQRVLSQDFTTIISSPSSLHEQNSTQYANQAKSLLQAFPDHESVWMFARMHELGVSEGIAHATELLRGISSSVHTSEYSNKVSFNARRFLAWSRCMRDQVGRRSSRSPFNTSNSLLTFHTS